MQPGGCKYFCEYLCKTKIHICENILGRGSRNNILPIREKNRVQKSHASVPLRLARVRLTNRSANISETIWVYFDSKIYFTGYQGVYHLELGCNGAREGHSTRSRTGTLHVYKLHVFTDCMYLIHKC